MNISVLRIQHKAEPGGSHFLLVNKQEAGRGLMRRPHHENNKNKTKQKSNTSFCK